MDDVTGKARLEGRKALSSKFNARSVRAPRAKLFSILPYCSASIFVQWLPVHYDA